MMIVAVNSHFRHDFLWLLLSFSIYDSHYTIYLMAVIIIDFHDIMY